MRSLLYTHQEIHSISVSIMTTNTPEYSVSELAFSLKRSIEEQFGHVRVRGELGRVTIARSGHCYLDVKDDKAVINSIIWKGVMGRLSMRPEEGMEVVCEGKLSTYPGRSNYQLIIDKMELAGAGALMALYEKRKKALAAEGLFDEGRKVALPFMPKTIGVVTSQTGAVIRDILHRISDRFPTHVLVWPVLVQGDKAAAQIASAITGFNHAEGFRRPDVLIVARGGGSLEDLWCFNEETVVRAVAASDIPVIGAVGHETDWTLVDYAADYRLPSMDQILTRAKERLAQRDKALNAAMRFAKNRYENTLKQDGEKMARLSLSADNAISRQFKTQSDRLDRAAKLLDAYSYQGVLDRGYALVQDEAGQVVRSEAKVKAGQGVTLTFADGTRDAVIAGGGAAPKAKPTPKAKKNVTSQQDLF